MRNVLNGYTPKINGSSVKAITEAGREQNHTSYLIKVTPYQNNLEDLFIHLHIFMHIH